MSEKQAKWYNIEEREKTWEIKELISYLEDLYKNIEDGTYTRIRIEPDFSTYYDDTSAFLKIEGLREETDEEFQSRLKWEEERKVRMEEKERREFERLKKKYDV